MNFSATKKILPESAVKEFTRQMVGIPVQDGDSPLNSGLKSNPLKKQIIDTSYDHKKPVIVATSQLDKNTKDNIFTVDSSTGKITLKALQSQEVKILTSRGGKSSFSFQLIQGRKPVNQVQQAQKNTATTVPAKTATAKSPAGIKTTSAPQQPFKLNMVADAPLSNKVSDKTQTSGKTQTQTSGKTQTQTSRKTQTQTSGKIQTQTSGKTQTQTSVKTQTQTSRKTQTQPPANTQTQTSDETQKSTQTSKQTSIKAKKILLPKKFSGKSQKISLDVITVSGIGLYSVSDTTETPVALVDWFADGLIHAYNEHYQSVRDWYDTLDK